MSRFLRLSAITLSLILTMGLIGCSSKELSTKEKQTSSPETALKNETANGNQDTTTKSVEASDTQPKSTVAKTPITSGKTSTTETKPAVKPAQTVPQKKSTATNTKVKSTSARSRGKSVTSQPAGTASSKTASAAKPKAAVHTVTFSLVGPKDTGTIIKAKKVEFIKGSTILDIVLKAVGKDNVDYSGSGATAYIEGIDNIYEFDYGAKSGWIIKQNGKSLTKSCGVVNVNDGDRIEFIYTQ